jgi:hypothetical protein
MFGAASMLGNLLAIHSETIAGTTNATKLNGPRSWMLVQSWAMRRTG